MTRRFPFATDDVFTDTRFGGNPLAVFPDARGLSDAEMQALAKEFNLSETTFVLPPEDAANSARAAHRRWHPFQRRRRLRPCAARRGASVSA